MTALYIVLAIAWAACGIVASGFCFAHYQRKYEILRRQDFYGDRSFAAWWLVGGPISLLVSFLHMHFEHGWLWPWSMEAYEEAGIDA